jgi:hypothetical protein
MIFAQLPIEEHVLVVLQRLFKVGIYSFPVRIPMPWESPFELDWESFTGRGFILLAYLLLTLRPLLAGRMLLMILFRPKTTARRH